MTENEQVKSKQRVQAHGEVYTNPREVNAMLDLVKQETERIDSRFLEPACGNGNFLIEVLRRKLEVVKRRYKPTKTRGQTGYEKNALIAISSIYGVELLADNAQECRDRLFGFFVNEYMGVCAAVNQDILKSAQYILSLNIICGDALTMRDSEGKPIIFAQWDTVGRRFKRIDYAFAQLLESSDAQTSFVTSEMIDELNPGLIYDESTKVYMPKPLNRHYSPINYWEVYKLATA